MRKSISALSIVFALSMFGDSANALRQIKKNASMIKSSDKIKNSNVVPPVAEDVSEQSKRDLDPDSDPVDEHFIQMSSNFEKIAQQYKKLKDKYAELQDKLIIAKSVIVDHVNQSKTQSEEIDKHKKSIQECNEKLKRMMDELDAAAESKNQLEKNSQDELAKKDAEIQEHLKTIADHKHSIEERETEIEKHRKALKEKEREIKNEKQNHKSTTEKLLQEAQEHANTKDIHDKRLNEIAKRIEELKSSIAVEANSGDGSSTSSLDDASI